MFLSLTACQSTHIGGYHFEERYEYEMSFENGFGEIPDGFILLSEALEGMDGILSWLHWKDNIVFLDSEEVNVFQRSFYYENFIIVNQGVIHVNYLTMAELKENAVGIFEQLNRTYNVEDIIKMRSIRYGHRTEFEIRISDVARLTDGINVAYEMNIQIYPSVFKRDLLRFFEYAENQNGDVFNNFMLLVEDEFYSVDEIDVQDRTFVSDGIIRIELDRNSTLDLVVLNIPRGLRISSFQNSTRRVKIE